MRQSILIFTLLAFSTSLFSNSKIDSLVLQLEKVSKEEKVDLLNTLCGSLKFSNTEKALQYGLESLALSEKLNYNEGKAKALYGLGTVSHLRSQFEQSNQYLQASIKTYQSINDASGIAKCWNILGANAQTTGAFEEALNHYSKALNLFETLADTVSIFMLQGNIGNIHYMRSQYPEALAVYEKLVREFKRLGKKENQARNLGNAALVYTQQGNYSKSLESYYEANEIMDSLGLTYEKAHNLNNIGSIFEDLDMIPEAIQTYEEALSLYDEMGQVQKQAGINQNLALCYLKLKNYDKGNEYVQKALKINEELGIEPQGNNLISLAEIARHKKDYKTALAYLADAYRVDSMQNKRNGVANSLEYMGFIYAELNDLEKAESHLQRAYTIWQELGNLPSVQNTANQLADLYTTKNECERVVEFQDVALAIEDSLFSTEKHSELTRVIIRQQLQAKEKELKAQLSPPTQNENKRSLLPIFIILGIVVLGLFAYAKYKPSNASSPETQQYKKPTDETTPQKQNEFLSKVDTVIAENLSDTSFNVSTLTKLLGINRTQLREKMKEATGTPPSKYIQKKRLEKAEQLLRETDMNISEVAHQIGFEANYFTRVFNQKYGVSPKQFRKEITSK